MDIFIKFFNIKKFYLIIIISVICVPFFVFPCAAQVIPDSIRVQWTGAGFQGNIPAPALLVNVKNYGAIGNGITDDYNAIVSAINALSGKQGVVYFPGGTYLIGSSLALSDSVILRGASSDSTTLNFNLVEAAANCINISKSQSGIFTPVTGGFNKGSTTLTVANGSLFTAGAYAELRQQNGAWDTQPASWATYCVGQILKVNSVSGNTLTIAKPLRLTYDTALGLEIRKVDPAQYCGIECMKIKRVDDVTSGPGYNIQFNYAVNCWVNGVESAKSSGSHILADASAHIQITGNYIHHAFIYDGVSTHGYGITLIQHTSECLIENNVLRFLRHAMIVKQGANGNVFAYNYSFEPNRTEAPTDRGGDISLHGHYPFANLFEHNIVQNIHIDYAWGPAGPFNTFFRNRADLYGIIMSSGSVESDKQNFVGNEITNTAFLYGNYLLAGTGHFQHGNNWKGTTTPSGTSTLTDSTYYLTAKPWFWNISDKWTSIGIANILSSGTIPAKSRYLLGQKLTICTPSDVVTSTDDDLPGLKDYQIIAYPNPNNGEFNLRITNLRITNLYEYTNIGIRVFNIPGEVVFQQQTSNNKQQTINIQHQPAGIYHLLAVTESGDREYIKIIKIQK